MILDANGAVMKKTTEAPFAARLFDLLAALSQVLTDHGIVLRCARCDGIVQGRNHPSDSKYFLECSCARREFTRQQQKVQLKEAAKMPNRVTV